jgi:hypothetical protein
MGVRRGPGLTLWASARAVRPPISARRSTGLRSIISCSQRTHHHPLGTTGCVTRMIQMLAHMYGILAYCASMALVMLAHMYGILAYCASMAPLKRSRLICHTYALT